MKILFIGDIIGRPGRVAVKSLLTKLVESCNIDFVIANGENSAGGFGVNEKVAGELFGCGVHILTTGNHVWDKKESMPFIAKENRVLRPANYPPGVPGYGSLVMNAPRGLRVGVLNLMGRVFMAPMDCPFRKADDEIEQMKKETDIIIVDVHAEATSEKQALGYYLDGRASAVIGTHTHVQTADERLLPKGTAYITDVGMTGPRDSIIGVGRKEIIERFLYQLPRKFEVAGGPVVFNAVVLDVDEKTGMSSSIERVQLIYGQ